MVPRITAAERAVVDNANSKTSRGTRNLPGGLTPAAGETLT
jgi:hypothetical protein